MAEVWPSILVPVNTLWHIKPMIQNGPVTFDGRSQRGAPDAGYWTATLSDIVINTDDRVLEFRALIASLQGGLVPVIVGPCDCRRVPRPPAGSSAHGIPYADQVRHSDGTGFRQSSIIVAATTAAALRATSLTVDILAAGDLRRGHYFSIRDRLYMITSVPEVAGDKASFRFLPPLREPVAAGDSIEFEHPRATMRLASGDSGQMDLEARRFARPSVELEESFDGL